MDISTLIRPTSTLCNFPEERQIYNKCTQYWNIIHLHDNFEVDLFLASSELKNMKKKKEKKTYVTLCE